MKLSSFLVIGATFTGFSLGYPLAETSQNQTVPYELFTQPAIPLTCQKRAQCEKTDAKAIATLLLMAGPETVTVDDNYKIIATSGSCNLWAKAVGTEKTARSFSHDVAFGTQHIIEKCMDKGKVAGVNAAKGNGNFHIGLAAAR